MMRRSAILSVLICALVSSPAAASAQTPAEIKEQIEENSKQIAALDAEIARYGAQLASTQKEKNTLQNRVNQLDLQRKQLNAKISVTQSQVRTTQLQIQELGRGIEDKEGIIKNELAGLAESIRSLDRAERTPLSVAILSADTLSDAWRDADAKISLSEAVREDIKTLAAEKRDLAETKSMTEEKQAELVRQRATLTTQQGSLDATRRAQNELLQQTKNQESTYQAILREKQAAKDAFEQALLDLNSQYQQALDPSAIPTAGRGVLRWPVDSVRITQYFGNTAFARSGAYNGKGHNGVDLAAVIGTPLRASLGGVVVGVGNTDLIRGCYSFGKWVMIRHNNGLSTMYSHLSQIEVTEGQSVATGQVVGYSGDTGYATGPHLHFGVYVTSATRVIQLGQATNRKTACSSAVMPVPTSLSGYLNPMDYLP